LSCSSACRIFIQGKQSTIEVFHAGTPGLAREQEAPDYRPGVTRLPEVSESFYLIVQISNFHHTRGGMWRNPSIGPESTTMRSRNVSLYWDFFLIGALLIMSAYHAGLSVLRRGNLSSFWLGLFCLMMALRTALTGEMSILEVFPTIPWIWRLTLEYMNFNAGLATFIVYCGAVFPDFFPKIIRRVLVAGTLLLAAIPLLVAPEVFTRTLLYAQVWFGVSICCMFYAIVRAARVRFVDSRLFLTGFVLMLLATLNDILYSRNLSVIPYMVPPGLLVFIVFQGFGLARRFSNAMSEVQRLNDELETRVIDRTRDMEIEKERALQASQAKSQFLSVMAHEVRTPLNVVLGNVHLLLEENLPAEQRRILESVQSSSQSLSMLLNEVLDLARIEAGKMLVQPSQLALREQLEEIVAAFRARAAERGNKILLTVAADVPNGVSGDRIKLGQILTNLLSNAIKFTRAGTIELIVDQVSLEANRCVIRFTVADTGIGIVPNRLEAIFEKFTQENANVSSKYGGTGLGLAIVQGLASLLGGTIRAESEPGHGSRFIVELPFEVSIDAPQQAAAKTPAISLKGLRVLAAEDNPDNMALLRRLLERWGAEIVEAHDGAEVVQLSDESDFDVILMDLHMPVMDGFEAARRITERGRESGRHTPQIISFTAAAVPEIRDRAYASGILEFLTKPVQPLELNAALARNRRMEINK
ncbi:MAG: response regulator, partial [Spirochaetia bacterium]|nr:response regulator [Spirochaetia bacterium]